MAISPFADKPATRDMLVDLTKLERRSTRAHFW